MSESVRSPVVAGMFYPSDAAMLRKQVESVLVSRVASGAPTHTPLGLVVPHAGYMYSGAVAGAAFREAAAASTPDVVVILGASHSGRGPWAALSPHTAWKTPLGSVSVDLGLVSALAQGPFVRDALAHAREHSIEVQLPFLQVLWDEPPSIVPICTQPAPSDRIADAARALATALQDCNAWIVASSDFTHYEPASVAKDRDLRAVDRIEALDPDGFRTLVRSEHMSICGVGAIGLLLRTCGQLGLTSARLVRYATSGDVTGDDTSVVGYASILIQQGDL